MYWFNRQVELQVGGTATLEKLVETMIDRELLDDVRPWIESTLGYELPEAGDSAEGHSREVRFVARLGVGYIFELSTVVLTPIVYFDLLEGVEDAVDAHLVYRLTVGFPF